MLKFNHLRSIFFFIITLGVTACGAVGGGDNNQIQDSIAGFVMAPAGVVAKSYPNTSFLYSLIDIFAPKANASVTGLTPVVNATVQLIRIDNSGNQVGNALAQGTTDMNGTYYMNTGVHGIPPEDDLVLQVTGNNGSKMRAFYAADGGADIDPISDYIVNTVISQTNVNLQVLSTTSIYQLYSTNFYSNNNLDFSSAMSVSDALNIIAADSTTSTAITDGVTHILTAQSTGLPIDMTTTSASSVYQSNVCSQVDGGWNYSFTSTQMTLVGTDTWVSPNCTLGPTTTIVEDMTSLAANYDIPFNCVAYPVCDASDFNKKLQGTDADGRPYTSYYSYDGYTKTLTYTKYVPEEMFTETIQIN